nr:enoyl-CoA hydratase/isomerase family protein [Saprospiraceae bacterium]
MTKFENIEVAVDAKIATITINRPKALNALNYETIEELGNALDEILNLENRPAGIILTGSGDKAFAAGADLKKFPELGFEGGKQLSKQGNEVFNKFENSPIPVIAAINGFALGGGLELAMACHLRIASFNAKMGQPEAKLGLTPGYAATQRLPRYIGKAQALYLLLTAEMIKAERALELGLVNEVVEADSLRERCVEILNTIGGLAPLAITEIIRCVNAYYDPKLDGYEEEVESFGKCMDSKDLQEGVSAFMEKRKANFTGE